MFCCVESIGYSSNVVEGYSARDHIVGTVDHKKIQVPKIQVLKFISGYSGGWVFPYISLTYSFDR